jgi:hypothetical protein
MQNSEALKTQSHSCAQATTDLSASLALAATLCVNAGAIASEASIGLLVGSVAAAEIATAYADLTNDDPQQDMYEVQYAEPITATLQPNSLTFEKVLENFTTNLLQLSNALQFVQRANRRLHATLEALEDNRDDPQGALFLDAQMFSTLQRQTLWRNLKLCTILQNDLLLLTPGINQLWRQFRLQVPSQANFNEHDVRETLTTLWRVRAQDINKYNLSAFRITDTASMLHILEQQAETLTNPVLLVQDEWHKSIYLLTQSLQRALDTFYSK